MTLRSLVRSAGNPVACLALAIALVGGTGVATAATGGNFLLGRTNYASGPTALRNTGSGAALSLGTAQSTAPPLTVGTNRTRVPYFNSDLLDGLDSAHYQRRVTGSCAGGAVSAVGVSGAVTCAKVPRKIVLPVAVGAGDTGVTLTDGTVLRVSCTVVAEFEGPRLFAYVYLTGSGIANGHATSMLYSDVVTTSPAGFAIPAGGTGAKLPTIEAPELSFSRQSSLLMVMVGESLTQLTLHLFADARDLSPSAKPCTVWGTAV